MLSSFQSSSFRRVSFRGAVARGVLLAALIAPATFTDVVAQPAAVDPPVSDGRRFTEQGGENVFKGLCQGCHMADGKGAKGAGFYPALAGNPKLASSMYPATVVANGYKAMPAFKQSLSDEQIADVVNYVRTHLGNNFTDPVSPADVKALR